MNKLEELRRRRKGPIGCPSDTKNRDNWDWDNWDNWPEEDKKMFPLKERKDRKLMKESTSFIDRWHDTHELLPDCDNVWFIADGKICVGMYEPEQQIFCMADGFGVELKDVRQWKYLSDKQLACYPKEGQIIAAEIPGFPCLVTGIFTDHLIDESTLDELSGVVLDEIYNFCDYDGDSVVWDNVFAWYPLPEEPLKVLEPTDVYPIAIDTPYKTDETVEDVIEDGAAPTELEPTETVEETETTSDGGSAIAKAKSESTTFGESLTESEEDPLDEKIKPWYIEEYPEDELGEEINDDLTFNDVFECLDACDDIYKYIPGDSIVRERIFGKLSELMDVDYDYIYDQWLKSADIPSSWMKAFGLNESLTESEEDPLDLKVAKWYKETYPTDSMGDEIDDYITFNHIFNCLDSYDDIYQYIPGDSVIRERVFDKLAELMDVDYDYIYDQWLKCANHKVDWSRISPETVEELYTKGQITSSERDEMLDNIKKAVKHNELHNDVQKTIQNAADKGVKAFRNAVMNESIRGNTRQFLDNVYKYFNGFFDGGNGYDWGSLEADIMHLKKHTRYGSLNEAIKEYVEGGSLDVYYDDIRKVLNKLYENTPEEVEKWADYPTDKLWERYIAICQIYLPKAFKHFMGRNIGESESLDESQLREGLTKAEKHNRSMDRIFGYKRMIDVKQAKFLLDHDVPREEVDKARSQDRLGQLLIDKNLHDDFWKSYNESNSKVCESKIKSFKERAK